MKPTGTVVTLMLVILMQLNLVEALRCYSCLVSCSSGSLGTPGLCPPSSNVCLKIATSAGRSSSVERYCASSTTTSACQSTTSGGITITQCVCNTDLCNSADTLHGIGQHQMTLCALSVGVSLLLAFFNR